MSPGSTPTPPPAATPASTPWRPTSPGPGRSTAPQFTTPLAGAVSFTGVFEGLGHTVTDLTIDDPNSGASTGALSVGLFGYSHGTLRDIGLAGGSVSGVGDASIGELLGANETGTVVYAFATGAASASGTQTNVGDLVGYNDGPMIGASATGTVTGARAERGCRRPGGRRTIPSG
jgi:hypothetical protein